MRRTITTALAALLMISLVAPVAPAAAKGRGGGKPFVYQMSHSSHYSSRHNSRYSNRGHGFLPVKVHHAKNIRQRHRIQFVKFVIFHHFFHHNGCGHGFGHGHGHKFGLIKHCPVSWN